MNTRIKCSTCQKEYENGIVLLNKYICRECEIDIITVDQEELKYEKFKRDIKHMWQDYKMPTI